MRPSDCALLVSVPLQRSEFMADLGARTDFVELFVASQRSRDLDVLWATYEASAATVVASTERARRRGVTVFRRCVLADFERCLGQFQVITLVAHWRSALFRASEILDLQGVARFVEAERGDEERGPADATIAAAMLNRRLHADITHIENHGVRDSHDAAVETRRQYALWHARRELQPRLTPAVRSGGPAVEFANGLVPLERVVAAVPEAFDGVLDLTVCNSALLAEEVRRRCRRGLIIANAFPGTLDMRMEFYNAAIDLVERRHVCYQDAVFGVREAIRGHP
jgi:hypothetical protein